ncbi:DUF488 domain-containing protein [Agromyces sp. LHK192]|uniref:DUF488 domain-containing protein n=1 Tax=Agromyces sp. LHK192 TaxID=2498704 RepID=UPI000FD9A143|nr:DUF488 family protein [Agromyces sp. LHK192]
MAFTIKRVHDEPAPTDGYRVLVDRLWPRGVSKERAAVDLWDKEVAPSPDLRRAWHHAEDRDGTFEQFAARYRAELDETDAAARLLALGREHDRITLCFGARDERVNHATVLLEWLEAHGASVERRDGE